MAGLGLARCRTQLGLGAEAVLDMLALGPVFTLPDEVGAPLDFRSVVSVVIVHDACPNPQCFLRPLKFGAFIGRFRGAPVTPCLTFRSAIKSEVSVMIRHIARLIGA
jgi:hypothetical protein